MTGTPRDVQLLDGPREAVRRVRTGAEVLADANFKALAGRRVALITNQTGLVGNNHLVDVLHREKDVTLAAILGPEHGFRGAVEAGLPVRDGIDPTTGIRVFSLYGKTRKPTPAMLVNADILVYDIQDIGARFYTYISTLGLAMQAAAKAGIPFMVLDRPNPLGGTTVAGHVLEPRSVSFVGQYPIPIVHGMTTGELAQMIKGERWLKGLERLDLQEGFSCLDCLWQNRLEINGEHAEHVDAHGADLVQLGILAILFRDNPWLLFVNILVCLVGQCHDFTYGA